MPNMHIFQLGAMQQQVPQQFQFWQQQMQQQQSFSPAVAVAAITTTSARLALQSSYIVPSSKSSGN